MKTFQHTIETDRLLLRPHTMDDVEATYQMNLDPRISKYTHDGGVKTKDEIRQIIQENVLGDYQKYGFGRFAVIHKEDNRFIGFAGLKYLPEMDAVDIGYRFLNEYWGRGIATEAGKACLAFGFEQLHLPQIIGLVLPANKASVRVLEKLGFTYEKKFYEEGELAHQYLLKAEEWTTPPQIQ